MINELPNTVPDPHRQFLHNLVNKLSKDSRIVGIAIGGSYLTNSMDAFSDLDIVCAIESEQYSEVMADRQTIAGSVGSLLAGFTGEHVGEPRLLICLYENPLIHVDFKFVDMVDVADRVEDPAILWERDGRLSLALQNGEPVYPNPDAQWIEDRFWIWVHYATAKIGRGELFEAVDFFSFVRRRVLGPLILMQTEARPDGVRKIENTSPEFAQKLRETIASYDAADCFRALRVSVDIYRNLRSSTDQVEIRDRAERAAMEYLSKVERQSGLDSD